ncbi:MAG: hypothetical protein ACQEWH_11935 [Bacillota bacterium]
MTAQTNRQKLYAGMILSLVFVMFVFSFSEKHSKPLAEGNKQENWHSVVDKASVDVYGNQLIEVNQLKKKLGSKKADSIITLLKLASEKHIAL